jgi:prepilin-type N-terminal cleavage/methylation domain-containing protein
MTIKNLLKKDSKGLTLVEVLISIILLAIVLAGGLAFYFNSSETMALATHKRIATEMAHDRLEILKAQSCSTITNTTEGALQVGGLTATRVTTIDPTTCEVNVTVAWQEAGKASGRQVSFDTVIAP